MAYNKQTLNSVNQIANNLYEEQSYFREKSNTIVTIIGFILTALISGLTYLVDMGTDSLPFWVPGLIPFLGMILTSLGVSQTKNGWTKSNLKALDNAIVDTIDARQDDKVVPQIPEVYNPGVQEDAPERGSTRVIGVERNIAESMDYAAKKIANEELR